MTSASTAPPPRDFLHLAARSNGPGLARLALHLALIAGAGFLLAIVGLAGLVISGVAAIGGAPALIDWRIAAVCLVTGAALTCWAGGVIGRRFVRRAIAAGYTAEQIREIEDEAERLNEKED